MKVTRIAYSGKINKGKYGQLVEQAKLLSAVRTEAWNRYGSINGVGLRDRTIRDQWLKEKRDFSPLVVNAWKETLRDAIDNIAAQQDAAKVKARRAVRRHTSDVEEQKRLFRLLKNNKWPQDKYLSRIMRKYWNRGFNKTHNQIIVKADNHTSFVLSGKTWLSIPSLVKYKRIAFPLTTSVAPQGTLRVILKDGKAEVHYQIEKEETASCGDKTIGIDKGFTEVFVDSDGERYGQGLGEVISKHSDYLKKKYQARYKLFRIAEKSSPSKRNRIIENNLGRKKLNKKNDKVKQQIRTCIFTATNRLVDKASQIISEDLTSPIYGKKFGKNQNRRLNVWTKGIIAEALENVSQRRCSSLHLVNAAYTSQIDHKTGCFTGTRKGDQFHCESGEVYQADENAAKNVLARFFDPEIDRWTPHNRVKSILLKRTDSQRLGLLNQDSSCINYLISTESETGTEANSQFH